MLSYYNTHFYYSSSSSKVFDHAYNIAIEAKPTVFSCTYFKNRKLVRSRARPSSVYLKLLKYNFIIQFRLYFVRYNSILRFTEFLFLSKLKKVCFKKSYILIRCYSFFLWNIWTKRVLKLIFNTTYCFP